MQIHFGACECTGHKEQIEYLKHLVDRLSHEREVERSEFKRAIDALLIALKAPVAIGQGSNERAVPLELDKVFGIFEESKKEEKE